MGATEPKIVVSHTARVYEKDWYSFEYVDSRIEASTSARVVKTPFALTMSTIRYSMEALMMSTVSCLPTQNCCVAWSFSCVTPCVQHCKSG